MRKIILAIAVTISIIVAVGIAIFMHNAIRQQEEYDYHLQEINEYYLYDGWLEIGYELAKKNNDWSKLPLSKKIRKKYNSQDGILGKVEFDDIKYRPYADTNKNWYFKDYYTYFVITQGEKQIVYHYDIEHEEGFGNWVDDIIILDKFEIVNESGNEKEIRIPFNDNTKKENLYFLVRGGVEELGVAVTDKFHKKYPFFLDLFIHYSPLSYNRIEFKEYESDLDNNTAIFEVNSILECKKRKYEVKLIFDDKLYLDDVEVKLLNTYEYKGDDQYTTLKILYKNSNWDNIKITDKYRKKFNGKSFIEDIDNIDINYFSDSKRIADHEFLRKYRTIDDNFVFYYGKFIYTMDEKIDDAKCIKLDYDGSLTIDEAAEKYLMDYQNK